MTDDRERYRWAAHAMQSGVAMLQKKGDDSGSPKHLRVGVNAAMSDHGGLVRLLIEKGVFTEDEYARAVADGMEAEAESHRRLVAEKLGVDLDRIRLA